MCLIFLYTRIDSGNSCHLSSLFFTFSGLSTLCTKTQNSDLHKLCIADLGRPRAVWAISSVHGQVDHLAAIHDELYSKIKLGDRLVYLGNYTGYGEQSAAVIDEVLTFRRSLLSKRGFIASDIVYLRGAQEEMMQKLMQIQFAPNPSDILLWMLGNGLSSTLYAYGLSPHDGIEACRNGVMGLTKWTSALRKAVRSHAGHEIFTMQLKRAAVTCDNADYPMLFVNAGLDYRKALPEQGDNFWWGGEKFEAITEQYRHFEKVVRGYDPAHRGVHLNCVQATIDGSAGFGGHVACAGWAQDGSVIEILES